MKTLQILVLLFALVFSFNLNNAAAQTNDPLDIAANNSGHTGYIPDSLYDITFITSSSIGIDFEGQLNFDQIYTVPGDQEDVRDAAAKMQCQNNLKQISLAVERGQEFTFIRSTDSGSDIILTSRETDLYLEVEQEGGTILIFVRKD